MPAQLALLALLVLKAHRVQKVIPVQSAQRVLPALKAHRV